MYFMLGPAMISYLNHTLCKHSQHDCTPTQAEADTSAIAKRIDK